MFKKERSFQKLKIWGLGCLFLAACAPKSPIVVRKSEPEFEIRKNIENSSVRSFPMETLKNLRMSSVTMLLWRDDISELDFADGLRFIRSADEVDEIATDYSLTQEQLNNENAKKDTLLKNKADLEKSLREISNATPQEDIEKWRHQLEQNNQDLQSSDLQAHNLQQKIDRIILPYGSLEKMMTVFTEVPQKAIGFLQQISDWFTTDSPSVVFKVKDVTDNGQSRSQIFIDMSGIKILGADRKKFSTTDGTIKVESYTALGSVIDFTLHASITDLYQIKIHRTGYEDRAGRILYKGDVIYKKLGANGEVLQIRRGQLKLANR